VIDKVGEPWSGLLMLWLGLNLTSGGGIVEWGEFCFVKSDVNIMGLPSIQWFRQIVFCWLFQL